MVQETAPAGTYEFEQVKVLSEHDADYIATWSAKAFSKDGFWNYSVTGKTYEEDPKAHVLYTRAMLDRASVDGYHVVNKTRTAIRTVFPPGSKDQRMDYDWVTPYDKHWLEFIEYCGGKDILQDRKEELGRAMKEQLTKLYGLLAAQDLFKTAGLAVHPDLHGRGVGTALHRYTEELARQSGKKWYFTTALQNQRFYENLGCKIVGDPVPTMMDERGKERYPHGVVLRICEVAREPRKPCDKNALPILPPEGSFAFETVKKLSDKDAEYIARWQAEAFAKTDCFGYIGTGKTYTEDPEAHYYFFRSLLDRAVEGYHVANETRTAIHTVFPPGRKDSRLDVAYTTAYDETFQLLLNRCGGADAVKARFSVQADAETIVLKTLYGDDLGLSCYRSGGFAVYPQHQGKGVGSAMHRYIAGEAKQAGKKWLFGSMEYNTPYYEKLGCKIVGEKIPTGIDEAGKKVYPAGNDFVRVCEVSPT